MSEMVSQRGDAWVVTLRGDSIYFTSVALPTICFCVQSTITGFKHFHRLMKHPMHPIRCTPDTLDTIEFLRGIREILTIWQFHGKDLHLSRRSIDPSTQGTQLEEQVSNCLNGNRSGTSVGWPSNHQTPRWDIAKLCCIQCWENVILCTTTASGSNLQLDSSKLLATV